MGSGSLSSVEEGAARLEVTAALKKWHKGSFLSVLVAEMTQAVWTFEFSG